MKKSLAMLLIALCILTTSVFAETNNQQHSAFALNELGLFTGTDKGFELDNQLKRSDGIALLVRLLGKEAEAKNGNYSHPFKDVSAWLDPYVGYAYANGLTTGISETAYGENQPMTRAQFYTLTLRALGYTDAGETPDFAWNAPYEMAKKAGLTKANVKYDKFTRGAACELFWNALNAVSKETGKTLSSALISAGVFTAAEFAAATKSQQEGPVHTEVPAGYYAVNPRTGNLLTKGQAIIDASAYAYWDKHMDTDYEMSSLFQGKAVRDEDGFSVPNNRREIYSCPEWASSEYRLYFDCSGYMGAVNNYVYGMDVRQDIVWNGISTEEMNAYCEPMNTKDAVYFYHFENSADAAEKLRVVEDMRAMLEPGDVVSYRRSTDSGHTWIYMDGGYTLESGGSSYYYAKGLDNVDALGTIRLRHVDTEWFNPNSSNYLFKNDAVNEVCILRPLSAVTIDPLPRALARLELGRLAIYKTAIARGQTVTPGQEITYTITLDNEPEADDLMPEKGELTNDKVVNVSDPLPTNVTFVKVGEGGKLVDGKIVFENVSVPKNTVKTLTYTVRVSGNVGEMVTHGETNVSGVTFTYHDWEIAPKMTAQQQSQFKAAIKAGKPEDMTALTWLNGIYQNVIGKDFGINDNEEFFAKLVSPKLDGDNNRRVEMTVDENSTVGKSLVKGYLSGRYIFNRTRQEYIDRIRYLKEESMQVGDILAERNYYNEYEYYIYLGADEPLVRVTDTGVKTEDTAKVNTAVLTKRVFALLRPTKM